MIKNLDEYSKIPTPSYPYGITRGKYVIAGHKTTGDVVICSVSSKLLLVFM